MNNPMYYLRARLLFKNPGIITSTQAMHASQNGGKSWIFIIWSESLNRWKSCTKSPTSECWMSIFDFPHVVQVILSKNKLSPCSNKSITLTEGNYEVACWVQIINHKSMLTELYSFSLKCFAND